MPDKKGSDDRAYARGFAAGRAAASPDPPNEEACLRWTCESCGWNVVVPMPGYAGDGHYHYERGNTPCGPLVARREGFIRARPGATLYFPAATSHGSDEGSTNPGDGPDHEPSPGAASPDERLREAAWPVELEVCPGCGTIIDIDAESCGCECPPRRVSKTFYLMHEADFLAAADRDSSEER